MSGTEPNKPFKPLGRKGYGSTPHLPGSRVGPGDWHIHAGQARILTEKRRDVRDRVIVTEKLDGSCVTVARHNGSILAVTRAGYLAASSPFMMHHVFARWVERRADRFLGVLADGQRIAGEWMLQAHGTRYVIEGPDSLLVGFAVIDGEQRLPHDEARSIMSGCGVRGAAVISDGPSLSVEDALSAIGARGFHGALDPVEGAVWVCERDGRFDFMAKHVVHGKADGCFLPVVTGGPDLWNFPVEEAA